MNLIRKLMKFAKKHEPEGGYFGPETLVELLEQDSIAMAEFTGLFEDALAEQLDGLEEHDELGWIVAGAADELGLLPDDPRLFKSTAELDKIPTDKLPSELIIASMLNHAEAIEYISKKVDVNDVDHHGQTALAYAIGNNNFDSIKMLIACGANLNAGQDRHGNTAMHDCAQSVCSKEVWDFLIQCGGDPHLRNKRGETAIDYLLTTAQIG